MAKKEASPESMSLKSPFCLIPTPQFPATGSLTSFSFSSRSLISSSYLSSLVEYFKRHTHATIREPLQRS